MHLCAGAPADAFGTLHGAGHTQTRLSMEMPRLAVVCLHLRVSTCELRPHPFSRSRVSQVCGHRSPGQSKRPNGLFLGFFSLFPGPPDGLGEFGLLSLQFQFQFPLQPHFRCDAQDLKATIGGLSLMSYPERRESDSLPRVPLPYRHLL